MTIEKIVRKFMRASLFYLPLGFIAKKRAALQYAQQMGYTESDFHREVMKVSQS